MSQSYRMILALVLCLLPALARAETPSKESPEKEKGGVDTAGTLGMKFVTIISPAERVTFMMGSPNDEARRETDETLHKVTLTHPFKMAATHVTRGQFAAFVAETGYKTDAEREGKAWAYDGKDFNEVAGASWRTPLFEQTDSHPVVEVSWNDATTFCKWLSSKDHKTYRLPTEAEWEYACRAGTKTAYFWGDTPDDGGQQYANCLDLTGKDKFDWPGVFNWRDGFVFTSPVASFKPNKFGLYDMIGNAWEFCVDYYGAYPAGEAVDPQGAAVGDRDMVRVIRGGAWNSGPAICRAASRSGYGPAARGNFIGFRVCLDF